PARRPHDLVVVCTHRSSIRACVASSTTCMPPPTATTRRCSRRLAASAAPGTFVEFGTSFGISTIYLAAAVRDRGAGRVITTELHAAKAARAREYIAAA